MAPFQCDLLGTCRLLVITQRSHLKVDLYVMVAFSIYEEETRGLVFFMMDLITSRARDSKPIR